MAANKKNNINVDRPIIQSSGYNGSEPVPACAGDGGVFVFVRIVISQNQSANLVSVKWEMVKLETSPGAKTVDKAG